MRTSPRISALVRTLEACIPTVPRMPTSEEAMGTKATVRQKQKILSLNFRESMQKEKMAKFIYASMNGIQNA